MKPYCDLYMLLLCDFFFFPQEYLTKVQLKKEITDLLQKQCSESNKVSELKEKLLSLKEGNYCLLLF